MTGFAQQAFQSVWKYLSRQRPEVVLLFCILASALYGSVHLLPSFMDRAERLMLNLEKQNTVQVERITQAFEADQNRDAQLNQDLLEKAFPKKAAVSHVP